MPEKVKVWRVQRTTDQPGGVTRPIGAVSPSAGFEDSPDAEVLAVGYNTGKENGAVAVGRHGSFLQWGFSAPPSKMTEAGRRFFLNCVCYIAKFDGKRPLVRCESPHRSVAIDQAMASAGIKDSDRRTKYLHSSFSPELLTKRYASDYRLLMKGLKEECELIYFDKVFRTDSELKSLGIESNRRIQTLEKLIGMLRDKEKSETARKLLRRYTVEPFETPDQWEDWLKRNREGVYFSDVGGYKFRVVLEGYMGGKRKN